MWCVYSNAVNATNQDIQAAEQRLPLIGNSCTITAMSDGISSTSLPTTTVSVTVTSALSNSLSSTRDDDRQQATTSPIVSDGISSFPTTKDTSSDNDQFLSLSLLEFILVVVILAVIIIAVFVVITVTCCCCLYVQRVQVENNDSEGKYFFGCGSLKIKISH